MTLAAWIGRAAWWLAPLARLIGTTVMTQPALHTDDTPTRTLAPGTGKSRWRGSGSMPWTRDPMLARARPRRSTATRPTGKANVRASICPGSAA